MSKDKLHFQYFLRYLLSWCLILAIQIPMVTQTLAVITDVKQPYEVMALDQQKSENEEQREEDNRDDKIAEQLRGSFSHQFSSLPKFTTEKASATHLDIILDILIPPPELI